MQGIQQTVFGTHFRVLSYGGGVDSMAMLVLAIKKGQLPDLVLFADVGDRDGIDPAEWPATYTHIREVVMPLCAEYGIEFKTLDTVESPIRGERSLFSYFQRTNTIPGRLSRLCTSAAKVERLQKFLDKHVPASVTTLEIQIGFEAGEEARAARDPHSAASKAKGGTLNRRINVFPLMAAGICRCRAITLIEDAGFQVPNGSACVYCPFSKWDDFKRLETQLPETFAQVQALEDNCKKTKIGKTMRYDYAKGDGTDPRLTERLARSYKRNTPSCGVCGRVEKALKLTSCEPITQFPREELISIGLPRARA
jgi:hypothetical protein